MGDTHRDRGMWNGRLEASWKSGDNGDEVNAVSRDRNRNEIMM